VSHLQALNDREHMRYSRQRDGRHTAETQRLYIDTAAANDLVLLDILADKKGRVRPKTVGFLACHLDRINRTMDMELMILPAACDKRYGVEAWQAVMDYWLSHGVAKVEAGLMASNFAMRSICNNTSMKYEGIRRAHFHIGAPAVPRDDLILYGKTAPGIRGLCP
jgi:RimJ/RimL family protein N-acetyltransferase